MSISDYVSHHLNLNYIENKSLYYNIPPMGIFKIFLVLFISFGLEARPISYSGGSTLMAFSDNIKDSLYYHYSPTYKYSIGIEAISNKYFEKDFSYLRFTYLLNRKNTDISQRNLYFQSGINPDQISENFIGMHGDWETRRWFTGFGYKSVQNNIKDYSDQYIQVGFAPYLGEYGDLHTWVMLKSKKNSLLGGNSTYPVLKFFKGNFLIEFGYNDKTEWDTHIMYRF